MTEISVIMPVYNTKEAYLRQSIESVLAQTFADFELIIVDDCSTNNAADVLKEYAAQDKRIKTITHTTNMGLSVSRNDGLAIAVGNFIAFLDSDDFFAKNFIELMLNTLKITQADIVGCDFKKIYSEKDILKPITNISSKTYNNALDVLLHRKNFIHFNVWNKIYKKEILKDIQFVPGIYYEDWIFNCFVFAKTSSFTWIKDDLYGYRLSSDSIMRSDFNEKKLADYVKGIEIVAEFYQTNYPNLWDKVKKRRISRTVKMLMNSTLKSKDKTLYREAKAHLQRLYQRNLIGYSGLSLINKIKLSRFLCKGK